MAAANLSPAQLRVLKSAAEGKVSRRISYPYGWRAADCDGSFAPRAVTCDALLDRGLISLDFERADARRVPAVLTDSGRALLATLNDPAKERP